MEKFDSSYFVGIGDWNISTTEKPLVPPLYADLAGYWSFHIYMFSFGYFSVAFSCFFAGINIKSQFPNQTLMFTATVLNIFSGLTRSVFLVLVAYNAYDRLEMLGTLFYAVGFPSITATVAMTIFSIAKHCLRTEPKSFIWLIIFMHFTVSLVAEFISVNDTRWRLLLQVMSVIFMIFPCGLVWLLANIQNSLKKRDQPSVKPAPTASENSLSSKPKKKAPAEVKKVSGRKKLDRRRYMESAVQTSFVIRRPSPTSRKSKSCGTINNASIGSQLTMPTSSVVSIDSLESWDQFSLQGTPPYYGSPVLLPRPISLPSVATGRKLFWPTPRLGFRKRNSKPASPSPCTNNGPNRKLRALNWRQKKPSESHSGNSGERETISGDDCGDSQVVSRKDSTGPGNALSSSESHRSGEHKPVSIQKSNPPSSKSLISPKLWTFIRAHYLLLLVFTTYCGMYLVSVFKYSLDIQQQTSDTVWEWFLFQSAIR
ncbi:hypothetical protein RvY_07775-2 [Ramazzottius varieornatus]|nr:hypothetical protein RvY_07775-2 [Ramazzottius varieornatus]